MLLQCLGLKEETSVEVSLDVHSLAVYLSFTPKCWARGKAFPWLGQRFPPGTCSNQAQNKHRVFEDKPKGRYEAYIKISVETPRLQC